MDFAFNSVCLNAATLEMSGFFAPDLIATAMLDSASVTSLPEAILSSLLKVSMLGRVRIATSAGSPASIRFVSMAAVPQVIARVSPLSFWNCGTSSSSTPRIATVLYTLSVVASARAALARRNIAIAAIRPTIAITAFLHFLRKANYILDPPGLQGGCRRRDGRWARDKPALDV